MKQYRALFWLYLVAWLALVLLPAACILANGPGWSELKQMSRDTRQNIIYPFMDKHKIPRSKGGSGQFPDWVEFSEEPEEGEKTPSATSLDEPKSDTSWEYVRDTPSSENTAEDTR